MPPSLIFTQVLLGHRWVPHTSASGQAEFKSASSPLFMLPTDVALLHDPEILALVEEFASDKAAFLGEFSAAWTKVMNADRFDGRC